MRLPKMEFDIKNFAKTFGETEHPIPGNNAIMPKDATLPSVDRTYKVYYGGAQKRPDGAYSRPVKNTEGKALAFVGDSNRKDVRNAVECAHKAQPGWGKRAAHNRAQIVYFMAENLEIRREEIAKNLSEVSGEPLADSLQEVDDSISRLFYWAAYSDKYGGTAWFYKNVRFRGLKC